MKETNNNQYLTIYMKNIIDKIHKGNFKTKDELLEELKNDEQFSNSAELRDDFYTTILKEFDEYEKKNENNAWANLKEQVTHDNEKLATFKDENGNLYTIQNEFSNRTIKEEINDVVNEEIKKGADAPKSVEDAFKIARNKVKIEKKFEKNNQNKSSAEIDALRNYFEMNNILGVEFSGNNLARDREGNLYEAIKDSSNNITITKTKTEDYSKNPTYQPEQVMATYENNQNPLDTETLNNLYDDPNFIITIQKLNIPADYKNYLIDEISSKKQEEKNNMQYENSMAAKVYQLKKDDKNYNGFVQVLLLSLITMLFSLLCVTNIYIQIIRY